MKHLGTMRLETERLILRQFTRDDLAQIYENCWSDYEVWKWTSYAPMSCIDDVMTKADMFTDGWLNAYSRPNRYSWAIELKSSGEVIGRFFGMHPNDELREVELACELGRAWWNQGLMTEATRRLIEFFIAEVGMERVWAWAADGNPASGRMQQKAGLKYECTKKGEGVCNAGVFDKLIFSVTATELR